MKNKGFTLVELLAVLVILGIITSMALIAVTRYRKTADEKDLQNLHSTILMILDNYRTDQAVSGNIFDDNEIIIGSNEPEGLNKYFKDLSYNGQRLQKSDLVGTRIRIGKKGELLSKNSYLEAAAQRAASRSDTASVNDIYIIDSTCKVKSNGYSEGNASTNEEAKINTVCEESGGNPVPSEDELICITIKYNDTIVVDDFGKNEDSGAYVVNKLCTYVE